MAKTLLTSRDWVQYFTENASAAAAAAKPPVASDMPAAVRRAIAKSLPAWQLGETSDGRRLRAYARQFAEANDDPYFLVAVELFICEEQRHGSILGEWLDLAGIPRKRRDPGDTIFRFCRHALGNYTVAAQVLLMVELLAEIYYAALGRLAACPRLRMECEGILRDEVRHIQFQCEHLAFARRRTPVWLRAILHGGETIFFTALCAAVWIAHGQLLRCAGMSLPQFAQAAAKKLRTMRRLSNPERYAFPARKRPGPANSDLLNEAATAKVSAGL
jgi:hypothetical protein